VTIELIKGDRGVFDVRADGTLIYSKNTTGRFPTLDEILKRL
jgi:predicted Rdx family selenoprotein